MEGTTTSNTSTSVTSGCRGQGFLTQFVRPHLTAGFTVFSAVVLGLSLVVIPPDVNGTRTEVRSVQLAAFRPHSATPLGAVLKQYVNTQANSGVSVTPVIVSGPDITTGGVPALLEFVRTAQSIASPTDPTGAAAQTGIDTVIPREQCGNFGVSAIPDLSQLASSFNPLWPLAVLFFVVVIPVFAVLLFFFPPAFPAASAIPEPLDLQAVPDKDVLKVAAAPPNSGEVVGESDGVGSNGAVGDSDRVASNRKGPDTRQGAASNQQTAGTGHATSKPAGPANSTADGDPSDASS